MLGAWHLVRGRGHQKLTLEELVSARPRPRILLQRLIEEQPRLTAVIQEEAGTVEEADCHAPSERGARSDIP